MGLHKICAHPAHGAFQIERHPRVGGGMGKWCTCVPFGRGKSDACVAYRWGKSCVYARYRKRSQFCDCFIVPRSADDYPAPAGLGGFYIIQPSRTHGGEAMSKGGAERCRVSGGSPMAPPETWDLSPTLDGSPMAPPVNPTLKRRVSLGSPMAPSETPSPMAGVLGGSPMAPPFRNPKTTPTSRPCCRPFVPIPVRKRSCHHGQQRCLPGAPVGMRSGPSAAPVLRRSMSAFSRYAPPTPKGNPAHEN
jgi:hypothetical protein